MLEVKNLSFRYHKKEPNILNDVSFSLEDNSIGIILGKNGSGKSTLFKNIVGILKPNSGTITLNNLDINELKRSKRAKKVAYVPQDITFGSLSVFDSILLGRLSEFGLISSYKDEKIVEDIIKEMGLTNIAFKNVNELSGGERQKVAIARALVLEPELIVFDEPTGNLDIANEQLILNEIKNIQKKKNVSILIAIHDLNVALNFGDKFFFIKEGTILKEGDNSIFTESIIKDTYGIDVSIKEIEENKIILIGGKKHEK